MIPLFFTPPVIVHYDTSIFLLPLSSVHYDTSLFLLPCTVYIMIPLFDPVYSRMRREGQQESWLIQTRPRLHSLQLAET